MTDISVSEKYLTTNKKIGLLYDNTQKKARIINYENHKYQDIDEVELGFASEFFDTILFTDKNENSITFASYTTEEKQKSAFKISKIENIKTDKFIRNKKKGSYYVKEDLEPCVIIDNKEKKILLLNDIEYPSEKMIVRFNDIISIDIIENGTTIFKKSTTRTITGALVGNALMGGAGAVVGGLSGNTQRANKIDSISVKILVRNVEKPTIFFSIYRGKKIDITKDDYKKYNDFANEIKDVVSVIIDTEDNATYTKAERPTLKTDITDELMKIAKLKDGGFISDEEFSKLKSKLLS